MATTCGWVTIVFLLLLLLFITSCCGKGVLLSNVQGSMNNTFQQSNVLFKHYLPPDFSYYDVDIFKKLFLIF